jgi:hypothetical protein
MASEARKIVESVLSGHMTAKVWTNNYAPVFPFTPQGFAVGALLPMMLYLFRWGHRRGRGKFNAAFSPAVGGKPTIGSVAEKLSADPRFINFSDEFGRELLGDLLLTSALENRRHKEGHEEQVQRCFPAHYMSSWIDLPQDAGALRSVPEMLVTLIAGQESGSSLAPSIGLGRYPVGARIQDNELVSAFAPGVRVEGEMRTNVRSDSFDEAVQVGLDQLLTVRLAQMCAQAPVKAFGKGEPGPIPNQRPIASRAGSIFREDFLAFFDCYGRNDAMPRLSLLPMLESAIGIGVSVILLSTVSILERWLSDGAIPTQKEQVPWPLFMDCSGSADPALRDFSEQASELLRQRLARVAATLMYVRLLDFFVQNESDIQRKDLPEQTPDAAAWLNLLGSVARGNHAESGAAEKFFRNKCRALVEATKLANSSDLRADILSDEQGGRGHGVRLAETLTLAIEEVAGGDKINQFLYSALMTDEPNGLARRRRITLRKPAPGGRKTADATSFVLTNTVLEYLVHRHLRRTGKGRKAQSVSLPAFLKLLRERYGFHVDQSPSNMEIPNELLQRNRRVLERRLRDLGLLVGVNDAERMKKLKARYRAAYDAESGELVAT